MVIEDKGRGILFSLFQFKIIGVLDAASIGSVSDCGSNHSCFRQEVGAFGVWRLAFTAFTALAALAAFATRE
jgi:hypothetical protein